MIVTANHVVRRDENLRVGLPDGETVSAALIGRDPTTDLAVLQAEASGLSAPIWTPAQATTMQVGYLVVALGRPGRTVQATLGIVSALGDSWRTPIGGVIDRYMQTDVLMYPGFSGGPLVDVSGQVMGLNTSAILRGISLTVPASTVSKVVEGLLIHGRVRRGYLGVSTQLVRLPPALAEELEQETGLLLVSVEPDSPADEGGLVLGDTIVAFDGSSVRQHDDLLALLNADRVDQTALLRIIRSGQVQELEVTVGERP
jgi:S1-C subfamily serine protease